MVHRKARFGMARLCALALLVGVLGLGLPRQAQAAPMALGHGELEDLALAVDGKVRQALAGQARGPGLVNIFIGDGAAKLTLQSVALVVDEAQPVVYHYSEPESQALNEHAMHHLAVLTLAPGTHRLRASFTAVEEGAATAGGRTPIRLDARVEVVQGVQEVGVTLTDESRFGLFSSPKLALSELDGADRWSRSAQFWRASGRDFAYLSDAAHAGAPQALVFQASTQTQTVLAKYNAAMDALAAGEPEALRRIVDAGAAHEMDLMLQDRAALALGYHYLGRGKNSRAAKYFSAVRRHSPYANRALIGLGWSRLSPIDHGNPNEQHGTAVDADPYRDTVAHPYLSADSQDYVAWARRRSPFRSAWSVVSARTRDDLVAAMTPWMELVAGDPYDPAVQEAMLTVPYTLLHLGASEQAVDRYRRAGRQLSDTVDHLQTALERVKSGGLTAQLRTLLASSDSGWAQWLCGIGEDDPDSYLLRLLQDGDFLLSVDGLRKLVDIKKVLMLRRAQVQVAFSAKKAEPFTSEIDAIVMQLDRRITQQSAPVETAAARYLEAELQRTQSYLAEAHFALARLAEKRVGNFREVAL